MKILKNIISFALVIGLALVVKYFIFSPVVVSGNSMYPNLHDKDIMILDRFSRHFNDYDRFDVIVVKVDNELLIKRVIGLPGETIEVKNNQLYVNNELVAQDFIDTEKYYTEDVSSITVSPEYYFVMGDNRPFSRDSRSFGLIHKEQILGRASLILYPFNRAGLVER